MTISNFNFQSCLFKINLNLTKTALAVSVLMILAGATRAQTLADLGATAPTSGTNDTAQLSTSGNTTFPDGLNYYTDDYVGWHDSGEPGQTFTTGTNTAGYLLTSLSLKTSGLNSYSGIGTATPYDLHIFSVSSSTATLLQTYTSGNVAFNDGDWLQWSGLSTTLAPNTTYAWSFGLVADTGYEAMAVAGGNLYSGGEIALIPVAGGTMTFGSSHAFDAVFDLGLAPVTVPFINQLSVSPTNNVFAGTVVTFTASVSGAQPLHFQWQFNNGGGFANISGANTNTLALTAAITNTGSFQLVVTNSYGAVTSAPVNLTVTSATISQLSVSPTNNVFAGTVVTFTASVSGAQPLHFQWQFNGGGGYANISGANTNTLALTAAVTNTGSYELVVTNSYGAVTSAPVALSVTLDTNPPVVLRAFNLGSTNVEVDFSKLLQAASAITVANYVLTNGPAVSGASLSANSTTVILTTAPLVYGSNYTLVINGILDQAIPPNMIATNTRVSFTASPRNRILLDTSWRFQLGDPVDVTTNVTVYPEIPDLAKLDADEEGSATNTSSESYMETIRIDPIATHAGENVSFVQTNYDDSAWRQINLPHDWAVELPFNESADGGHGFKPVGNSSFGANNFGWYRHTFTLPANDAGQALWLEFGGVYRNCLVWLNGHILGRNVSGYSSFYFDVTPYANPGGTNVLVVRVDASRFEGWFYEGAGIYRHVWLTTENPVHVAEWGTFVATTSLAGSNATLTVQTDVTNQSGTATANGSLTSTIFDASNHAVATITTAVSVPAGQDLVMTQTVAMTANLWSLQSPYLYNLVTTVSNQNAVADIYNTPFGVRTVSIDSTNGVFINGQHVEIQGMCNHQDMAGVGSALPDRLQYYRIERLKEMGVNGYRTSHNEPTAELLNACDQLGMLVLDENRRIGTNAEPLGELSRQIRRDRNHPSVFMWSLANEETLQATATGASIMQVMQNLVHSMDSTRLCTAALNSWGSGFSSVLDVNGFNYALGAQDSFHASNPGWPIIGTETSSMVTDRGVYTNDTVNGYVWGYDVNAVQWGETAEVWWPYYDARPWASGGFSWTGFDYRGEPTPYGWPCINSHFGTLDTCGFPKDNFYYYQANWTLKPVLHVFPHWNWSAPGQPVNIWVFGNCDLVELFTNGVSLGRQVLNVQSHVEWDNVPYASGTLQAVGYLNGRTILTNTVVTTGTPAAIALWPDRSTILADGQDVSVVTVAILDSQGHVVPIASNLVNFAISGGAILGVGNGDPSSHEADKASQRSVFNGFAQVIIQSINQPGSIALTATSTGLTSTNITITEAATLPAPAAPTGVAAVGGNAQVTVSWDIVPGATTYNLWRATTSGGPYTLIAGNIGGVNLGCTDNNVTNLTTYYYVVTAVSANGTSMNSAQVSATPQTPPVPTVPTGLTAIPGDGQVSLSWTGSSGATNYNVKRSTTSGGTYTTVASTVTTSFVNTGLTDGTTYYFEVSALNPTGESANSGWVSAKPTPIITGLSATFANSQVELQWNAYPGVSGYNVKRSLVSGGPYTTIAASLTSTNFTDVNVTVCQTYYYVVTITNAGTEDLPSTEVSATWPGVLPPQFTSADIGAPSPAGSAGFCGGQFTVSGGGADIWGTSDAFQFVYVYVPVSTNCDIRAQVLSVQDTSSNAKAGIMIRETLGADSRHAMADVEPSAGLEFITRTNTGAYANSTVVGGTAPNWVRLTRTNNNFQAYYSSDGNTWNQIGSTVVISNMAVSAYAGLIVCSHDDGTPNTSLIDNVAASFITNLPPTVSWIAPTNNSLFIQPRTITLTASATDTGGTVSTVAFYNGTTLLGNATSGVGNQYSLTWSNAATGSHTLSACAMNNWGATNNSPATIAIVVQPLTLTLPVMQTNGQFRLTFQGQNGQNYVLETSTNLTDWTPVWTNAPTNGVLTFTNLNATDRLRLYRVSQ
jgi:beta-galactosidase